jgi:hypothetical protein
MGIAVHRGLAPEPLVPAGRLQREKVVIVPTVHIFSAAICKGCERRRRGAVAHGVIAVSTLLFTRWPTCRRADSRGLHARGS